MPGRLFVTLYADGKNLVASVDPNTGKWETITSGNVMDVSRDGKTILFYRDKAAWVHANGNERRLLDFDAEKRDGQFLLSPDGKRIAYSDGEAREFDFTDFESWLVHVDGSGRVRLPLEATALVADWSRDGDWLLVQSLDGPAGNSPGIWKVRLDGSERRLLAEGPIYRPSWSPDGRMLVYSQGRQVEGNRNECDLFVAAADGSNPKQVFSEAGTRPLPCWSPDSRHLAVTVMSFPAGAVEMRVEVMTKDGAGGRKLEMPKGWLGILSWR